MARDMRSPRQASIHRKSSGVSRTGVGWARRMGLWLVLAHRSRCCYGRKATPAPMTPYTVHAIHPDGSPAVIYLLARSAADALLVAAELFQDCTPVRAEREGEW